MATQAVPKIIQRFRGRELQRILNSGGAPPSLPLRGTKGYNAKLNELHVSQVNMDIEIQNPFLAHPMRFRKEGEKAGRAIGKWTTPKYSLRRQAVLVKAAREAGVLHLLPPGPKCSVEEIGNAAEEVARKARIAAEEGAQAHNERVAKLSEKKEKTYRERRRLALLRQKDPRCFRVSKLAGVPEVVFRWTGKAPQSRHKGLTIYEGRRRMFKGHKWERHLDKRRAQIAVRMRDMATRIQRFKNVYKRKQPKPLDPAPRRKKESLPF